MITEIVLFELPKGIRALHGSEPQMTYFDTLLTVDNVLGQVSELAQS